MPSDLGSGVAQLGVNAITRVTHANRASATADGIESGCHDAPHDDSAAAACSAPNTTTGDGCPGGVPTKRLHGIFPRSPEVWLMTHPIASLETVSLEEALAYLDTAEGDELQAAYALAKDRNQLDGSVAEPDDAEVHHALFLLRRARGLDAPSFDLMRIQLKRLVAA